MVNEKLLAWANDLPDKFDDVDFDIFVPRFTTKEDDIFIQDELIKRGAIPIHKLEVGKTYIGSCRNASEAVWQGDHFVYQRYKFGTTYPEKINHFQDDDGYDVFVPIKLKDE
jgi:hypothetical protein